MAQKLGLGSEVTELKLGKSFMRNGSMGFNSVRCKYLFVERVYSVIQLIANLKELEYDSD